MKTEDVVGVIMIVILMIILSFLIAYIEAHGNGFMRGAESTRIYYEARGSFPSDRWLTENEGVHILDADDVIESLKPFEEK